ncbi:FecR domain-containing protein [Pseudomonas iridis]|uniref:FecR domain-containing protein n=1 Tax=Pseudomonas iridis TaxID=2710587 RepID=UPI0021C0EDD5|nr:FecR domain-containing protein [Pseudomonas iridis]MCT8950453.1 FecR domain-containing protein [Pseudomonas iridis]
MPVDKLSLGRRAEPQQQVVKQAIHWLLRLRNNHGNSRLSRQCEQWRADYATATGERRGFQLPDGTRIELNTASTVDLDYTAQQRLIKLTRGEILVTCGGADEGSVFERPLRVQSRHGVYEPQGARFVLRQDSDCTRLSVTSGCVAINAGGTSIEALAGQSYLIDHHHVRSAPPLNMDVGARADGLIVTRNMRLGDFLSEVGRYRQGFLSCASDVADLRLSGVFRLEDTDKLLAILPRTLPVQLRRLATTWAKSA